MKRTFLRILPVAAALLLATSCSKDSDNDTSIATTPGNNLPAQEQVAEDNQAKTIPFSITVGKDTETLSKATLQDGTTTTQVFEAGDVLVLKNGETEVAELTLAESDNGKTTATFSGTLATDGLTSGTTEISVTLKNDANGNIGTALTAPQTASTLAEAFKKYGYWTSSFTYTEGETPTISLTQNTAFVKVDLPFHGTKVTFTINGTTTTQYLNGDEIIAIPNGTAIKSQLLGIDKTVTINSENNKVVLNIKNRTTPTDCIAGVFSVAADKQIFFSEGNLQYHCKNNKWTFASNQYDYIGSGNEQISDFYDGYIDLFGWGMWLSGENPTKTSTSNGDYLPSVKSGEFSGKSAIGEEWATLSTGEWQYLLGESDSRNGKYGIGTIHNTLGLIILPDGYTAPTGITTAFVPGTDNTTYNDEDWSKMESAGAVFLPTAGRREGTTVTSAGSYGDYCSSSAYGENNAVRVHFHSGTLTPVDVYYPRRSFGFSVRLVRSL